MGYDYRIGRTPAFKSTDAQVVDGSKKFAKLRDENAAAALAWMFEGAHLPGRTARQRLDAVLDYTASEHGLQFRVDFSDCGFREELRDSSLYESGRSNQVGHFLTAVKLGLRDSYADRALTVGHELSGGETGRFGWLRKVEPFWRGGLQVANGLTSPVKLAKFEQAVACIEKGDRQGAKRLIEAILPDMAWSHPKWKMKADPSGRLGNSRQDLLLSAYGFALAAKIDKGELKTAADVAKWIRENIAAPPASIGSPSRQALINRPR